MSPANSRPRMMASTISASVIVQICCSIGRSAAWRPVHANPVCSFSTLCIQFLEYILRVAADLTATLFSIGPRRCGRSVRIQHGQYLLGMLPRQIFLSVCQIRIGKVIVCVGRVRISEEVELKDLERRLGLARAHMVVADDADRCFRPQSYVGIFPTSLHQLPRDFGDSAGLPDLI